VLFHRDGELGLRRFLRARTGWRPDDLIAALSQLSGAAGDDEIHDRAIAEAKVKTDKVGARILAQLLAAEVLTETSAPDDRTRMLRVVGAARIWSINAPG